VVPVGMADDMGEKPKKVDRVEAHFAIDRKKWHDVHAQAGLHEQDKGAYEGISEHHWGVILDTHGQSGFLRKY
jgi:hypothetical protein